MDYRETGLPQDPTVFKAFMTFSKNVEQPDFGGMAPPMEGMEQFPVRVAQVLYGVGQGPQMLSLALLNVMPPQTYSIVEKSFGRDVVALMEEAGRHNRTDFAYISEASDSIKLLTLASSIATFDDMRKLSEKAEEQLTALESGQPPADGNLMIPMLPDMRRYDRLGEALVSHTSSPALENMFIEKLGDLRIQKDQLDSKLASLGIMGPGMGMDPSMGMPGSMAANDFRYPAFEDTKLMNDPKVQAAYDVLKADLRVRPEDFEGALAVGELLSTTKNPLAVAGALLDVGIQGLGPDDFPFLDKKLDWDVIELVKNNSLAAIQSPVQLDRAPQEFKMIAVANAAVSLGQMRESAASMLDMLKEQGEQIPEQVRPMLMAQALQPLNVMSIMMDRMISPVLGKTGTPEIDDLFRQNLTAMRDFIKENVPAPKPRSNNFRLPGDNDNDAPPKGPKKGFGQDFSLD